MKTYRSIGTRIATAAYVIGWLGYAVLLVFHVYLKICWRPKLDEIIGLSDGMFSVWMWTLVIAMLLNILTAGGKSATINGYTGYFITFLIACHILIAIMQWRHIGALRMHNGIFQSHTTRGSPWVNVTEGEAIGILMSDIYFELSVIAFLWLMLVPLRMHNIRSLKAGKCTP